MGRRPNGSCARRPKKRGPMSAVSEERAQHRTLPARAGRLIVSLLVLWLACSPGVGSDTWCEKMEETPKADWSTREATDFTKHCIFK